MARKPMTMAQFEKSKADRRADREGAKKAGMTEKAWEKSAADKKADRRALNKINAKRKSK